jgi:hypothetical protein
MPKVSQLGRRNDVVRCLPSAVHPQFDAPRKSDTGCGRAISDQEWRAFRVGFLPSLLVAGYRKLADSGGGLLVKIRYESGFLNKVSILNLAEGH